MSSSFRFSYKLFNPLFWHVREALRDDDIRYIINRGGSSSGKSVSVAQAVILSVASREGSALVLRKTGASIKNTVYEEFKVQIRRLKLGSFFNPQENCIKCINGQKIDFSGLDNPEKIKSITNYRYIVMEEANEFDYPDFAQITFRLRGKPGLKIIITFNPISEELWIKKKIMDTQPFDEMRTDLHGSVRDSVSGRMLDMEYSKIFGKRKSRSKQILNERTGEMETYPPDTIELVSTYKNNFWIVGSPDGKHGYYDKQTIANYEWYRLNDYNFYRIYALAEWGTIRTGGEFWTLFNANKHVIRDSYNPDLPIHISVDNNVLPYITVLFFQYETSERVKAIRQIHEICAEEPNNTVTSAAYMSLCYLREIGYNDVVFVYGDASTRARNTIDDEKRSFLDKFMEGLEESYIVRDCVSGSNPSVSMTGEFINGIFGGSHDGYTIEISESCKKSIEDYMNVKKDANGAILKVRVKDKATNQIYERFGHCSDCLRYVVYGLLKDEYIRFSLSRKRSVTNKDDYMMYDPQKYMDEKVVSFIFADVNGLSIYVRASIGSYANIQDVSVDGRFDEGKMKSFIGENKEVFYESAKSMYKIAHQLREKGVYVWISKDYPDKIGFISSMMKPVKERVRLSAELVNIKGFMEFYNMLLDYDGMKNYEAIYVLCRIINYLFPIYFAN